MQILVENLILKMKVGSFLVEIKYLNLIPQPQKYLNLRLDLFLIFALSNDKMI